MMRGIIQWPARSLLREPTMIAYAVVNAVLDKAIAIFATKEAAEAYAAGFEQCSVVGWRVEEDLFDFDC